MLRDGNDRVAGGGGAAGGERGAWLDTDGAVGKDEGGARGSGEELDDDQKPGGAEGTVPGALDLHDGEW